MDIAENQSLESLEGALVALRYMQRVLLDEAKNISDKIKVDREGTKGDLADTMEQLVLLKMSNKDKPHVLVLNRAWYSLITRSKYLKTIRGYQESLVNVDRSKYDDFHASLTEDEKVFLSGYFDLRAFIGDINDGYQTDKAINITPILLTKGKAIPVSLKRTMGDLNHQIMVDGECFEYDTIEMVVGEDNTLESIIQ